MWKLLQFLVFFALGFIAATAYTVLAIEDFPYGASVSSSNRWAAAAGTYTLWQAPSSASETYVYQWYSTNAAGITCGPNALFIAPANTFVQTYTRCVGYSLKWAPVGGGTYNAVVVRGSAFSDSGSTTNVEVDITGGYPTSESFEFNHVDTNTAAIIIVLMFFFSLYSFQVMLQAWRNRKK